VRGDDEPSLLLSDGSAAGDWDLAKSVLDRIDPDGDPPTGVVPVGDLGLFGDLGLDSADLGEILGDLDAYADEMLSAIAQRLGFAAALDRALDAAGHWAT
jgi:putative tRNA adenosine deaminase-associated protein